MNYNITLTSVEITLVGQALDLLPHGKVAALVRNIQLQIKQQEALAEQQRQSKEM